MIVRPDVLAGRNDEIKRVATFALSANLDQRDFYVVAAAFMADRSAEPRSTGLRCPGTQFLPGISGFAERRWLSSACQVNRVSRPGDFPASCRTVSVGPGALWPRLGTTRFVGSGTRLSLNGAGTQIFSRKQTVAARQVS